MLKISVVTVCYNAAATIEETIQSVLGQTYPNVEYIIIDGGSTDGTVDIIKKYADRLTYWVSEPDKGMYDAIRKGFCHVSGDICCYINADDFYHHRAFETVADFFVTHPNVDWIKGLDVMYNEKGVITNVNVPTIVINRLLRKGMYVEKCFIQQESTFWRSKLNATIDMNKFAGFKLAGDYYLWSCFSSCAELHIVPTYLGGFRVMDGQLSSAIDRYIQEIKANYPPPTIFDKILLFTLLAFTALFRGGILYRKVFGRRIHYYSKEARQFI